MGMHDFCFNIHGCIVEIQRLMRAVVNPYPHNYIVHVSSGPQGTQQKGGVNMGGGGGCACDRRRREAMLGGSGDMPRGKFFEHSKSEVCTKKGGQLTPLTPPLPTGLFLQLILCQQITLIDSLTIFIGSLPNERRSCELCTVEIQLVRVTNIR